MVGVLHYPQPMSVQFVFIDEEAWVCTATLNDLGNNCTIKRFFFLPRDWLNMESLELIKLTSRGGILCPKDGEVALIQNGLDKQWFD